MSDVCGWPPQAEPAPPTPPRYDFSRNCFPADIYQEVCGRWIWGWFFNGASCWKSPKIPQHPFFLLLLIIFQGFFWGDREIFKIAQSPQFPCPSEGLSTLWLIPWLAFGDCPTWPFGLYFLPWQLCFLLKVHLFSYTRTSCHRLVNPLVDSHCSWDKS